MFHVYLNKVGYSAINFWTNSFKDKRITKQYQCNGIFKVKAVGFEGFRMAVHLEYL